MRSLLTFLLRFPRFSGPNMRSDECASEGNHSPIPIRRENRGGMARSTMVGDFHATTDESFQNAYV
jgi:hypothetical protein